MELKTGNPILLPLYILQQAFLKTRETEDFPLYEQTMKDIHIQ